MSACGHVHLSTGACDGQVSDPLELELKLFGVLGTKLRTSVRTEQYVLLATESPLQYQKIQFR